MSWFFLVPGRVPGLVSLFFWHSVPHHFCFLLVPARVPEFVFLSFLVSGKGFCFIVICWLLLVFATVLGLISLFSFCSFSGKGLCYIVIFWFLLVPGWGSVACPPSFLSFFFRNGATNEFFIVHERREDMVCCCLGSMLV